MEIENRELAPPWIVFPLIPWLSANWMSGPNAFYFWRWSLWFRTLDENQRNDYLERFPEPPGWAGFLDFTNLREYREHLESEYKGINGDPFERLLVLLLREAAERRSTEIEIEVRDQHCTVRYVRDGEIRESTPMPKRLFGPFKDCVARKCGKIDGQGDGRFVVSLNPTGNSQTATSDAHLSVAFRDSSLRLTVVSGATS
jgi:hypothetical protein